MYWLRFLFWKAQISLLVYPGVVIVGNTLKGEADERESWYPPFISYI